MHGSDNEGSGVWLHDRIGVVVWDGADTTVSTLRAAGSGIALTLWVIRIWTCLNSAECNVSGTFLGSATAVLVIFAFAIRRMRRANMNKGEYLGVVETYMRMTLRAPAQCRATLETLATIKNPPVLIAKKANIAHGPQQVNNGTLAPEPPHAREKSKTHRTDYWTRTMANGWTPERPARQAELIRG